MQEHCPRKRDIYVFISFKFLIPKAVTGSVLFTRPGNIDFRTQELWVAVVPIPELASVRFSQDIREKVFSDELLKLFGKEVLNYICLKAVSGMVFIVDRRQV